MSIKYFKQIMVSGVLFLVIAQVINTVSAIFTMSYYTNPEYFGLWSKLMMPSNGPPGSEYFLASITINLVTGIIFAGAYSFVKQSIPGKGIVKGIYYGVLLFLISGVPFTLTIYLLFSVPVLLLLNWTVSNMVVYLIGGAILAKIIA
ncbi:Uncharacterised protein [uncultured archaeon]|nr:Uncharacterised protein [uncultured archaeon]